MTAPKKKPNSFSVCLVWDDTLKAYKPWDGNTSSSASPDATGSSPHFDSDADNTAQSIKASAGNLYKLNVYNPNTAYAYVQIFDVATGSVTVGTTVPDYVVPVPALGSATEDFAVPLGFSTAITYAATTTATGSGDPTTGLTLSAAFI